MYHVIGAGLAGLSAAVALTAAGQPVTLHEAAAFAGGRCRSYFDRELGCRVDNGNHLLLSGNRAALAYLDRIGARATLAAPAAPAFAFLDLASGQRWTVRPNLGRLPWWLLVPARRVAGTRARDYLALLALRRAGPDETVAQTLADGTLYRRLLAPLAIAALNTPPEAALARLLAAVMDETLLRGGAACIPLLPRIGLSESFVDPALAWLAARGAVVRLGSRVVGLRIAAGRLEGLDTPQGTLALAPGDGAVLAVPPGVAAGLLAELAVPDAFQAIVNLHFRADPPPGAPGFIGLIGGAAEWVFAKPGHVSVTISAANRLVDQPAEALATSIWPEVCQAMGLAGALPSWRVLKEKRATFAATAAQERLRPHARSGIANLALAGDWTATGLPATIEGAIRSGQCSAEVLLRAV